VTPVNLTTDPNGNIVYGDFGTGTVHRIRYAAPTASFTATPSNGTAPLTVSFDASASEAISPATIIGYDWDFGDGSGHGSGVTTSHLYAAGTYTARLTVTDSASMTATTTKQISSGNTPPSVTLDQPNGTTPPWKVGDTITLQAHASDAQDGTLAASRFSWHVGLQHCHSADDCHEHDLLDPTGVTSTTFVAPDHDAGSFLRITVTVTDSGGLPDSKTIDLQPLSTTMTVKSSPAGLPVTLDGVSGAGTVGPQTMLVGHAASVQAQSTAAIGETMYGFSSWSDGGALTHTVNAPATATTLTATYHLISDDAPDTCAAAPVQPVGSTPVSARFGKANDVDWIKFSVSSTRWYRFVVGDLPVDAVMTLYRAAPPRSCRRTRPGRTERSCSGPSRRGRTPSASRRSVAPRARRRTAGRSSP
jgi:PKD repeat protein